MRLAVIFLACTAQLAIAQYQDSDNGGLPAKSQPPIPIRSIRFQRPAGKPIATTQAIFANQRARRPIPLARPKGVDDSVGSAGSPFPGGRPFRPNLPSGPPAAFAQQVKPVTEESYEEEDRSREIQHDRPESRDQDQEEDDEPEEEDSGENIPRGQPNLGSISRGSINFVPNLGVPQPQPQNLQQPTAVQYRPAQGVPVQAIRPSGPPPAPVQYRPSPKPTKPRKQLIEEQQPIKQVKPPSKPVKTSQHFDSREKKPVAQTIRRYRNDNDDGSITWGFENDDGSYKEEIIGVDCITRGKYGYVDADGFRREYTYETGIKCDEEQRDEDEENGFVDYQENKLVLPSGKTVDLSSMGKKQTRRPRPTY